MRDPLARRRAAVALAVLVSAVPARTALTADLLPLAGTPRLDLVWVDPTGIAGAVFPRLAVESRSILDALGAEVDWRAGEKGVVIGPGSMAVIAVPTFHRGRGRERHVMGATRRAADGALAVWVFPDQVAWALGLDLETRGSWGMHVEDSFARAVARVASHEIVHALGAPGHARRGLMTAVLDREKLLSRSLDIDAGTIATVRRRLDHAVLSADGRAVLPPAPAASIEETTALAARSLSNPSRPIR